MVLKIKQRYQCYFPTLAFFSNRRSLTMILACRNCYCFIHLANFLEWYLLSCLGMDAQVSYAFHSERKLQPEKFKNQLVNQVSFLIFNIINWSFPLSSLFLVLFVLLLKTGLDIFREAIMLMFPWRILLLNLFKPLLICKNNYSRTPKLFTLS